MQNYSELTGKNVLVTTQNWFITPNGEEKKAIWGKLNGIFKDTDTLGFAVNRPNTNWYVSIGNMTVAGCQILYLVQSDECNFGDADGFYTHDGKPVVTPRPTFIYNANRLP